MDRATRKRKLKKKEAKIQKKIHAVLADGAGKSETFWKLRRKLNKIQWRIYKLSHVPITIIRHGKKDRT